MRKQTKIAAVVSAAALLALGASLTSFAASRGTWMPVDGEWYCYDSNGDMVTDEFCLSNGKEYYVGSDGMLVRSDWVDYGDSLYFVNSSGQKITNDWRLTTPFEDDEADEEWFYFGSTGKMTESRKIVYKGKTYYFDTDGKMLTGWVTAVENEAINEANSMDVNNTYYCDETGARIEKLWVYDVAPDVADDDIDAEAHWYYLGSKGKVTTGKGSSINGQTFFFDEEGRMLTGWVAATDADGEKDTIEYYQLYTDEESEYTSIDTYFAEAVKEGRGKDAAVYYCGYSEDGEEGDGHAKKSTWRKLWGPNTRANEEASDQKWFWFEKSGKVYVASANNATPAVKYSFEDGVLINDGNAEIQVNAINGKNYWFNLKGEMVSGFYMLDGHMYYFGGSNDGAMKTGAQTIKDDMENSYKFYFSAKTGTKGQGITGYQSGKLYYFGYLIQATDYDYQIAKLDTKDGVKYFIVNSNGRIHDSKKQYKEDGNILINASAAAYVNEFDFEKSGTYQDSLIKTGTMDLEDVIDGMTNGDLPYVEASDFVTGIE